MSQDHFAYDAVQSAHVWPSREWHHLNDWINADEPIHMQHPQPIGGCGCMSEVRQPAQGTIVARVSPSVLLVVLHRMLSCFVKASTSARTASVKREASRMRLQEAVLEPHG